MTTAMATKMAIDRANKDRMFRYLLGLGFSDIQVWSTSGDLYATVSQKKDANISDFTQISKGALGDEMVLRLSKKDFNNPSITKGRF